MITKSDAAQANTPAKVFEFDRYVNGRKMAEGVAIHRAINEEDARRIARTLYQSAAEMGELRLRTAEDSINQLTTPTPVTVERLTNESVRTLRLVHKLTGDPLVIGVCDELLAARETIAKLESDLSRAIANHSAALSRSPAVDTAGQDAEKLAALLIDLDDATAHFEKDALYETENMGAGGSQIALGKWRRYIAAIWEARCFVAKHGPHWRSLAALTPLTTPVAEAVTQPITEQGKDAERYRWLKTRINWNDNMVVHGLLTMDQREWTHIDVRPAEERPDSEHIDEYIDSRLAIDAPSSCTGEGKT